MSISIIIPCLNEADGIVKLLVSLQPMMARGVEIIVVDGGSHDDTLALARPWADIMITAPRGRASQMNAGASRAHGEILLFLHADCSLPDEADDIIVRALDRSGKSWGRFDARICGSHPLFRAVELLMNLRSRVTGIATGDQGLFVTRTMFEAAGRFSNISLMEDVELAKRLNRSSPPLCLTHRITVSARRWEKGGVLRTILLMWYLRLAYWLGADPNRLAKRYAYR